MVLASKGKIYDMDEYDEEEELNENLVHAKLYFKSLTKKIEWTKALPEKENILLVSVSSQFVYLYNNFNLIRVLNFGGVEVFNFTVSQPLVAMSAFEHLLAVVIHDGLPLMGCQNLSMKRFNMKFLQKDRELKLGLSPYEKLEWFGFSDDGVLYCQDSSDTVRINQGDFWVPVYENRKERRFRLIDVIDKDLIGVKLNYDEQF